MSTGGSWDTRVTVAYPGVFDSKFNWLYRFTQFLWRKLVDVARGAPKRVCLGLIARYHWSLTPDILQLLQTMVIIILLGLNLRLTIRCSLLDDLTWFMNYSLDTVLIVLSWIIFNLFRCKLLNHITLNIDLRLRHLRKSISWVDILIHFTHLKVLFLLRHLSNLPRIVLNNLTRMVKNLSLNSVALYKDATKLLIHIIYMVHRIICWYRHSYRNRHRNIYLTN